MNKSEERKVVEMVFGGSSEIIINESERPDFVCRVPDAIEFGVEVTDFYLSESVARLRNIKNYAIDLLSSKSYRHKDDKERIRVDKIIFQNGRTGEEREIQAIIGEEHTIDDVVSRIKAAIDVKTDKSTGYSTEIVDLVIRDVESIAGFDEIEKLVRAIGRTDAYSSILRNGFREIYLLTKQKNDWVCVPLRANLFVAEILKFQQLFRDHHGSKFESMTIKYYLIELARHLSKTFGVVEFDVPNDNQPRLIFGSVAVGYGENQALQITDISINSLEGREIAEFDDAGDVALQRFVETKSDGLFTCAPVLFPAKQCP